MYTVEHIFKNENQKINSTSLTVLTKEHTINQLLSTLTVEKFNRKITFANGFSFIDNTCIHIPIMYSDTMMKKIEETVSTEMFEKLSQLQKIYGEQLQLVLTMSTITSRTILTEVRFLLVEKATSSIPNRVPPVIDFVRERDFEILKAIPSTVNENSLREKCFAVRNLSADKFISPISIEIPLTVDMLEFITRENVSSEIKNISNETVFLSYNSVNITYFDSDYVLFYEKDGSKIAPIFVMYKLDEEITLDLTQLFLSHPFLMYSSTFSDLAKLSLPSNPYCFKVKFTKDAVYFYDSNNNNSEIRFPLATNLAFISWLLLNEKETLSRIS